MSPTFKQLTGGWQNILPQNMTLWYKDYFELKHLQMQEGHTTPTLHFHPENRVLSLL